MLNSVSFSSSITNGFGVMPVGRGRVIIGGKSYPVIKVPDNNPLKATTAQEYCEVVMINGKKYRVETVPNPVTCDGTKGVVVVEGECCNVI